MSLFAIIYPAKNSRLTAVYHVGVWKTIEAICWFSLISAFHLLKVSQTDYILWNKASIIICMADSLGYFTPILETCGRDFCFLFLGDVNLGENHLFIFLDDCLLQIWDHRVYWLDFQAKFWMFVNLKIGCSILHLWSLNKT